MLIKVLVTGFSSERRVDMSHGLLIKMEGADILLSIDQSGGCRCPMVYCSEQRVQMSYGLLNRTEGANVSWSTGQNRWCRCPVVY